MNFILTNNLGTVPIISIIDFIIALHLNNIPVIKSSDVLFAKDADLVPLAQMLLLTELNKEQILRILGFLRVLDNVIFENLDCKDIYLACTYSQRFSRICTDNKFLIFMRVKIKNQNISNPKQNNREKSIRLSTYSYTPLDNGRIILKGFYTRNSHSKKGKRKSNIINISSS